MRTALKKWFVVLIVVAVLVTARIRGIAHWLERYDLVYRAHEFERTYLTGTTIAVLVIVLILLRDSGRRGSG